MPIPIPLIIAGMALSAVSSISAGAQARKMHNLQAESIRRERDREVQIGKLKADQEREANKRRLATQANLMAGRGGDPGAASNLLLVGDFAGQAELNARLIEQGSAHKVMQYDDEIGQQLLTGRNKQRAGLMKAGTALLSGAEKIYTG